MLYVFIGKSAAGKDYLYHEFLNSHPNIKEVVSYTTRPPRPGEVDGVDYHFVSESEFMETIRSNQILEYRSYKTKMNGIAAIWYYGSPRLTDINDVDYAVVLDPDGARTVVTEYGVENCMVTYVTAPDALRLERARKRSGFDQTEWDRRFPDDNARFNDEMITEFKEVLGAHFKVIVNN